MTYLPRKTLDNHNFTNMKELTFDEIKQKELELLIAFDDFCSKNNLKYILTGGTLIGAVRHKGFIPWDDDIDVEMPRPDYERFKEMTAFNPIAENIESCSAFPCKTRINYPFIKLVDMTTIVKEKAKPHQFMGIFIDVFPLDGIADDVKTQAKVMRSFARKTRFFCACTEELLASGNVFKTIKRLIPKIFLTLYGTKRYAMKMDRIASRKPYETSDTVATIMWGRGGIKECKPKFHVENTTLLDFEGHKFSASAFYDEDLTKMYGNYMELPPESERESHSFKAYALTE